MILVGGGPINEGPGGSIADKPYLIDEVSHE